MAKRKTAQKIEARINETRRWIRILNFQNYPIKEFQLKERIEKLKKEKSQLKNI